MAKDMKYKEDKTDMKRTKGDVKEKVKDKVAEKNMGAKSDVAKRKKQ